MLGGRPGRRGEGRRPVLGEGSEAGGVWRLEERGEERREERREEATERESVDAEHERLEIISHFTVRSDPAKLAATECVD